MTPRRGKCGGRAGRRLGTPRAAGTRCSPRSHKPARPDGANRRRAVPQPPAAPPARGASGRRARAHSPRTTGPAPFCEPLPRSFLSSPSSASPRRALQPAAKFSHDPGDDIHETVGRGAGVRSAARPPSPAGKLGGRVQSSRGGGNRGGVKSPRADRGPGWWRGSRPAVRGWGWRNRLPRGRGAQGIRRRCCACSRRSRRRRPRLSRRLH